MSDTPSSGLTEGLELDASEKHAERTRYEIGEPSEARQTIDATWSKRKKITVGIAASVIGIAAIGGGAWFAITSQPPKLPETAEEAVAVISSAKFDRLDEVRQKQYFAQAGQLISEMDPDARRALFQDEANREAMRKIGGARMNEVARMIARGETPDWSQMMRPPRGGPRPDGGPNREEMTEEQREEMRDRMRDRINDRIQDAIATGNSQDFGLMGEMMSRRGGGGPGGRGRGGGGGGGRD